MQNKKPSASYTRASAAITIKPKNESARETDRSSPLRDSGERSGFPWNQVVQSASSLPARALMRDAGAEVTNNASMAGAESDGVSSALRAISQAARIELADVVHGVRAEYQRRVAAAVMTAHPAELRGILRALADERRAVIAILKARIGREAAEERQAVIDKSRGLQPKPRSRIWPKSVPPNNWPKSRK